MGVNGPDGPHRTQAQRAETSLASAVRHRTKLGERYACPPGMPDAGTNAIPDFARARASLTRTAADDFPVDHDADTVRCVFERIAIEKRDVAVLADF